MRHSLVTALAFASTVFSFSVTRQSSILANRRSQCDSRMSSLAMSSQSLPLTELCHISKDACDAVAPMLMGDDHNMFIYHIFLTVYL